MGFFSQNGPSKELKNFNIIYGKLMDQLRNKIIDVADTDSSRNLLAAYTVDYMLCNPLAGMDREGEYLIIKQLRGAGVSQDRAFDLAAKQAQELVDSLQLDEMFASVLMYKHLMLTKNLSGWADSDEGRRADAKLAKLLKKYSSEELSDVLAPLLMNSVGK